MSRTDSGAAGARPGSLAYLGALALVYFAVQAATGILLMFYYRPLVGAAYYSTGIIMDEVRLGWLIRSLHRWGADLVILVVFLHMIWVYFSRAYCRPRQFNWAAGIALLVLVVSLGFTGTLLPWDQYAYWYIDSARAAIASIPGLGNILLGLFWGGWEIGEEVLLRFYAVHVGVLPWAALAFLLLHMRVIWRTREVPATPSEPQAPAPPDFLINALILVLLVGGALFTLAVLQPPVLSHRAEPLIPLTEIRPRWYLLAVRHLLELLPGWKGAAGFTGFFILLFLVPVIDRRPTQSWVVMVMHRLLGLAVVVTWAALTVGALLR